MERHHAFVRERKRWTSNLLEAASPIKWLMVLGLCAGMLLALGAELLDHGISMTRFDKVGLILMKELGMGLIVAAIAVLGYELLPHVSKVVDERLSMQAGVETLSNVTDKLSKTVFLVGLHDELSKSVERSSRLPTNGAQGAIAILEKCAASKACISNFEGNYALGALSNDGYRTINVSYRYRPLTPAIRKLKIRCFLPDNPLRWTASEIGPPGYDLSWALLWASPGGGCAFPDNAFQIEAIEVNGKPVALARPHLTQRRMEFETVEDIEFSGASDLVEIRFCVQQSEEYSFVSDRVTDVIQAYDVRCTIGVDAKDVMGVLAAEYLSHSESVITTSDIGRQMARVTTGGWVLPGGGVAFSWSTAKLNLSNSSSLHGGPLPSALGNVAGQGRIANLGPANSAAKVVSKIIKAATFTRILNTYLVSSRPYTREVNEDIENAIAAFLKRSDNSFTEICSKAGCERVDALTGRHGKLPANYRSRVIKQQDSMAPILNFLILIPEMPSHGLATKQIFLGWDYSRQSRQNENVFWSDDRGLVEFYEHYFNCLCNESVSDPYPST